MDFVNVTKMPAGWTMGFDCDGRELLIVVIKATFNLFSSGQPPEFAKEQAPLVEADVFTGEPGFSATLYETDYSHRKPKCDVLLNGSAYAPHGEPVNRTTVSLSIGSVKKSFAVVGNRTWHKSLLGVYATPPERFTAMPISYDNAFGGVDKSQEDPIAFRWYPTNHAGKGYHEYTDAKSIEGKPLPNSEEIGHSVDDPRGRYRPMAFGAIGRSWQQRAKYAGTYTQQWLDEHAPFWPDDFDYCYFQAAPVEQQLPHLVGGEEVLLENLTPEGHARFQVPRLSTSVVLIPSDGPEKEVESVIDTILIEPDKRRFMLTERRTVPMKRSIFDIKHVIVGESLSIIRRKRLARTKMRYANLAELVTAKRAKARK